MAPAGIAVTVEKDVRAPLEATFRTIVRIELARIFRGPGPIARGGSTRKQTGAWDHVGASRIVELSDGSQAHEQLVAYEPPRHFAYRLDRFTGPVRGLVPMPTAPGGSQTPAVAPHTCAGCTSSCRAPPAHRWCGR